MVTVPAGTFTPSGSLGTGIMGKLDAASAAVCTSLDTDGIEGIEGSLNIVYVLDEGLERLAAVDLLSCPSKQRSNYMSSASAGMEAIIPS